jgi:hypothetical protein
LIFIKQVQAQMIFDNFIGIVDDFFSAEECQNIIDYFNLLESRNLVLSIDDYGDGNKTSRDDSSVFMMSPTTFKLTATGEYLHIFTEKLKKHYQEYVNEFGVLKKGVAKHGILGLKVQKTPPGGGFHYWHFENANLESSGRLLTIMVYLNNIVQGGETEFLYYKKRVEPKMGRLLIWPSGFTHTHRGNPPLTDTKYILTGRIDLLE